MSVAPSDYHPGLAAPHPFFHPTTSVAAIFSLPHRPTPVSSLLALKRSNCAYRMEDVDEIDIALAVEDHAAALREQSLMGMDAGGFVGVGKSTHHSYDYTLDAEMEAELELLASSEEASDFTGDGSLDEEQYYHSDPDCLFNDVDCLIKDEMSDPVEATSGSLEDVGALSESMQTPRLGSLSGSSESVGLEESSVGLEEPVGSEQSEQSVDSPHLSGSCDSGDVESGPATDPTGITTTESLFGDGSYLTSDFLERTRELEKGGLMQDAQSNLLALATLKAAADAMAAAAAAESISYPVPATTPTQPRPELSPSESSNVATPTPTSTSASTSTSPLVAAKSQLSSFRLPPGLMAPLSRKKEDGELQRKVYPPKQMLRLVKALEVLIILSITQFSGACVSERKISAWTPNGKSEDDLAILTEKGKHSHPSQSLKQKTVMDTASPNVTVRSYLMSLLKPKRRPPISVF
ncbi:hypothetical protein HK104_006609 [Borealophlyctis nickersoniae]|nr:hypothetical protein HK104_006609 [Borealophlyctis nickersoniae]